MTILTGHRVVAWGGMAQRPLARVFATLGAEVIAAPPSLDSLAGASFVLDDLGLARLSDLGLERAAIEARFPALVHVSVTPFGSHGPRARWRGGELVVSAMGGVLRLTGEPDRPPVKEALDACLFHADMVAASGAFAAHHARGTHGRGQHVDVSAQEVAFSRNVNGILVWHFDRRKLHRVGGALNYGIATVRCIWPLADGWCFHTLMTGRFGAPANQALSDWMDELGVDNPLRGTDWLAYNRSTLPAETRARWERGIEVFFRRLTRAQVRDEGRRRGINACAVATPADVLADPHLVSRGFWRGSGAAREPSRFAAWRDAAVAGAGAGTSSHAPASAPAAATAPPAAAVRRPGPLAGLRVLDFAWALVGSITTKVLGDLGADVIKVESRSRPCLSRLDVQVSVSRAGDFDDKPWFAHLNTSKRSLALDMKQPASREILEPLLQWADVVVENFSPGTMAKLGLDYQTLARQRPDLVMVSGSVYGQTGPLAQEWGVDGTGAALSGRTYLTGWPDRDPVIPGSVPYGDVIVPYVMAALAALAVQRRRETGRGAHIDASMYEICAQQMWAAVRAARDGQEPRRQGNDDAAVFRQGVFPAAGTDRWIVVSADDAAEWQRLLDFTGVPELSDWTSRHEDHAAVEQLQAAGFAAGIVQDIEDLVERDPGLAARGALVSLDHARLGTFGHVRTPVGFSLDLPAPYRPPSIGEHGESIARELSGLGEERIAELRAAGVFR